MRHISGGPVFVFLIFIGASSAFALWLVFLLSTLFDADTFLRLFFFTLFFYIGLIACYRLWIYLWPVELGVVEVGSSNEFRFKVYILFWLLFFNPFTLPCWVPIPMTRLMYRLLGAEIGPRSYSGGVIYDPQFVEIGSDTLLGARSMLVPHFSQGHRLEHHKIKIGNHVTVGLMSVVMAGCEIGDGAILGAMSFLPKNSKMGPNEVWAGCPAKFIRMRGPEDLKLSDD